MLTLSKDMETGVSIIDAQHKELIDRVNAVTAMGVKSVSKEETKKTLDLLGDYIIKHFRDEEEVQKRVRYPHFEAHRKQHQFYIGEFKKLKDEFNKNGVSARFTLDLNNSIITWIVRHIKKEDVALGQFLNS